MQPVFMKEGIALEYTNCAGKGSGLPAYKENAKHGDVLMPLQLYRCIVPYSYRELSLHWHEEMEVTRIVRGGIRYTIDLAPHLVQEGDLLLIPPHTFHSAHALLNEEMTSDSLVFHLDILGYETADACTMKYLSPVQKGKYSFVPVVHPFDSGYRELSGCIGAIIECLLSRPEGFEMEVKEFLFRFYRLLYQYGYVVKKESSVSDSEMEEKLKRVLSYVREHYEENLTVSQLAKVCHFSEAHFMNFFKRFVGMTCIEYINHYRLTETARTLAETRTPVMEAALANGFRNVSYFNKLFRREFQMTPTEYRKKFCHSDGFMI